MTPVESSALGLGGERRGRGRGWEEVDEGVGEEVPGSSLRPNICQTSTHTHLGNQVGARGLVATAGARSELTAGCFAWKKRSLVNPAGVKFHRALTCNDITKHGAHLPLCPATFPHPSAARLPWFANPTGSAGPAATLGTQVTSWPPPRCAPFLVVGDLGSFLPLCPCTGLVSILCQSLA